MSKILVLGDGLLGSEIVKQTLWDKLSRSRDGFDIRNLYSHEEVLKKYDTIVNCIAFTSTYSEDSNTHWNVNYKSVALLSYFCRTHNIKLVHISTDHVYANSPEHATEETVPQHLGTWYGYTKLLGDAHVQMELENYLIIRASHKPYPFPYENAWSDQLTNGDYVTVISKLIIELIRKGSKGIYNIGTAMKTWYGLTREEFSTTPILSPEGAPKNVTMNLTKLQNELKGTNQ